MIEAIGWIGILIMGLTLGLMGGGGSILTVPILVYFFSIPPVNATSYSLAIVGVAALFAVISYFKAGLIEFKVALFFVPPALLGILFSRRILLPALPEEFSLLGFPLTKSVFIMAVFAVVMLLAATFMIKGRKETTQERGSLTSKGLILIGIEGTLVGIVTGFVGAGGGFLIVPSLVALAHLPIKRAVATSLLIIAVNSISGFLGDSTLFDPNTRWGFLLAVLALSAIGIVIGTKLNKHVSANILKPGFGWFTLIMGGMIFYKELTNLH